MTVRRAPRRRCRRQTGGKGGAEPQVTIRRREQIAVEMSANGSSQYDIAEQLGISQPAVSKILRRVDDRWIAENQQAVGRHTAKLFRQGDAVFRRAIVAFDESRGERTRKSQRQIREGSGAETVVTELTAEMSSGDPRHLEVARKTVADQWRAVAPLGETSGDLTTDFTWRLDRPTPPTRPDARPDGSTDTPEEDDE